MTGEAFQMICVFKRSNELAAERLIAFRAKSWSARPMAAGLFA